MFQINSDDMSIYLTRGDTALFPVYAMKSETERYVFQPGDVVRIKVFEKKACENVVLQKDFGIEEETEFATIQLDERETKIGEVISKPKDYWYEIELNPFTEPQTIVGYDDDGPKVLKLFPEGADVPDVPIEEEDIPIVDSELDLTSTRPVSNHAVSKGFLEVKKNIEDILKITSSAGVHYEELVVVDNETASIKAISNGTNVAVMISVKLSASQVKVYNASILENRDMFEPLNIYEDTKTGILAEMITNGENHKIQFTHNRHNDYDELLLGFTNKTNSEITINHCITYPTKKTSMQEVTDARRDYKGKIYESLGEHVRALGKYSNDNCTDLHTNDDIFLKHIVLSDSEEDETLLMTGEIDRLGIVSDTLMNYAETFSNSENVSISEDSSINFNTPGIYKLNVAMTIENVYSGFDLNISLNGELFNNHFVAKQGTHTYEFDKVVLISRPTTEKLFITDMSSEYLAEITNSVLRVSEPAFIGKVSNEQIEQVVEDYLAENQIEGGATAEQLAQIEQNKKDIGQLSATIDDMKNIESGQPTPVSLASEMTDTTKIYLYVGSEDGYTNGHFYYYNGTSWVSGGKYGGEGNTGGINSTARALLISILRNGIFSTDQSANITALETALESSGSGGSGSEGDIETTYTVVNVLTNVTNNNDATFVTKETSYNANLTADDGYNLDSVTVTMGGVDITSTAYSNGVISIASVTGNIVITANAKQDSSVAPAFELTSPLVLGDTTDSRINDTTNNRIATGETVNDDEDWTVCVDFTSLAGATVVTGNNGVSVTNGNGQFIIMYEASWWYCASHGKYVAQILNDYQKVDNVPQYTGKNFVSVITWNSSTKTFNCYGTKESTLTHSTISTASEGQLSVGNKNAIGTINRFALYKRILSADEITAWIGQGV